MSKTCGCAAKIGPGTLANVLGQLPKFEEERLLVGIETSDDAAVYKINDETALIQTLDFFTPIADDPYRFGQIAASNSLSDVYAMGGEPKVALNIVAFPNSLDTAILGEILKGGADKVREAGAVLVGGHSIQDDEPKYGLSVSGFAHPDKIWKNHGSLEGDVLILTKQIGNGVVNTAIKVDMASEEAIEEAQIIMAELNKKAKEVFENFPVSACTDITGFGLLGHAIEMATASEVTLEINADAVPYIEEAIELAKQGLVPVGAYKNREFGQEHINYGEVEECYQDLLHDPQTSGGLLCSVPAQYAEQIMQAFEEKEMVSKVAIIGKVIKKQEKSILLTTDCSR